MQNNSSLFGKVVPPEGSLSAPILIIGEAPGQAENAELRPFVGGSGLLLRRLLRKLRIPDSSVLFTNVFSRQPMKNNTDLYFQDKRKLFLSSEGQKEIIRLTLFLEELNKRKEVGLPTPNIIVVLGAVALKLLTGKSRITKWRGSLLHSTLVPGFKVYPTYHPSYVLRLMNEAAEPLSGEKKKVARNALPIFEMDFERIKSQAENDSFPIVKDSPEVDLPFSAICQKLREYAKEPLISVDIETLHSEGKTPILWQIGFAKDAEHSFNVPFIKEKRFAYPIQEEAKLLSLISEIFLSPSCFKITQGGTYDLAILGKNYGLRFAPGTWHDTLYLQHSIFPTLPKDLGTLTSLYTWRPYFKDEGRGGLGARTDRAEALYNAKDCCATWEIFCVLKRKAQEGGYYSGYLRTMKILPSHLAMTLKGVLFDTKRQAILDKEFKTKATEIQAAINLRFGSEINLASSTQKKDLLYSTLKLAIQYNPKTKKITTDKDALLKLSKKYPDEPVLNQILTFQKFNKLQTTYTSLSAEKNSRVHTAYSVISTWRMNSYASPFGTGGNLQNIPKRGEGAVIRSLFIPDPGHIMLASDRAQAEAMVVAWDSKDLEKIKMFRAGWDVHWFNAKKIFGLKEETEYLPSKLVYIKLINRSVPMKVLRNVGKTVVHAANYGMMARMLQTILTRELFFIRQNQAQTLLQTYFQRNPKLQAWHANIRRELQETRTLISVLGRKRIFRGRMNNSFFNAGYAFKPQSYVGELTELTIQALFDNMPEFIPLLNVHDEVVGQVLEADAFASIAKIRKLSSMPVEIHGEILDIPVDFKVGYDWQNLHELSPEEQTSPELFQSTLEKLKAKAKESFDDSDTKAN